MTRTCLTVSLVAAWLIGGCPRNTPTETATLTGSLAEALPTAQAVDCPGGVRRVAAVVDGATATDAEVDENCSFSLVVPAGRVFALELRDGDGNAIAQLIEPNPRLVQTERLEQFIRLFRLAAGASHELGLLTIRGDMAIPQFAPLKGLDSDSDGVVDALDSDADVLGLVTDDDADSDGVVNAADNCPFEANPGQEDADENGVGDACEPRGSGPLHGRLEVVLFRNYTGDDLQAILDDRETIEAAYPQANVTETGIETGDIEYQVLNFFGMPPYQPVSCFPNHKTRNCQWIDISSDGIGLYLSATKPGQTDRPPSYDGTPWPLPIPVQRGIDHTESTSTPCRTPKTLYLFNNRCADISHVVLIGPGSLTPRGNVEHFGSPPAAGALPPHLYLRELIYTPPDLAPGESASATVVARSKGIIRRVTISVSCPPLDQPATGCSETFIQDSIGQTFDRYELQRFESGNAALFPLAPNKLNAFGTSALSFGPVLGEPGIGGTGFDGVFTPFSTGATSIRVMAVNDLCTFGGEVSTSAGSAPFISSPAAQPFMITLMDGHMKGRVVDINRDGLATGYSLGTGTRARAFFFRGSAGGPANYLPTRGAAADARQFAGGLSADGSAIAGSEDNQAKLWTGANFETITDLPPLVTDGLAFAGDVENGIVVGAASKGPPTQFPFVYHPVIWRNSETPLNLNTIGAEAGEATGVNAGGLVVGLLRFSGGVLAAFAYTQQDGTVLLNDRIDPAAGITLLNATAVNNRGQILCHAFDASRNGQIFVLLTPPAAATP